MEGKLLQKTKVNVSDTDYNKKTIGNQVSTEQMYLGYVWFKRWPYCIIMMYSDVFLHYIDDRDYNWHQCIMDWVMRNILGVFCCKIQ